MIPNGIFDSWMVVLHDRRHRCQGVLLTGFKREASVEFAQDYARKHGLVQAVCTWSPS